ncbi:MAG TPA: DNA-formamidopyrimidine glycosylase family protein [Terracidiphilus sp.]|jgi:endonuclease-8|nr:DNA-formamidopyrimidine glycosylase family protein [Terracidiphilus sp.]
MPEGDTIFRTARALTRALVGQPITGFRSNYPLITRFHDDTPLTGQQVDRVESRGKWLLIYFSSGGILVTHMLMSGSWHIYRPGEPWQKPASHMRVVIENNNYHAVGFSVPVAHMHTARSLARDRRIPQPAADVLNSAFDSEAVTQRILASAHEEIGDVLLHQQVLAGVGNVFKSEVCFVCGVNPFTCVRDLNSDQIAALIAASCRLIASNVLEDSGDTIVTFRGRTRRTTHTSDPTDTLWVYGRRGEPCRRCGERIRRRIQGPDARVTFWCQMCQPMPHGSDIDSAN